MSTTAKQPMKCPHCGLIHDTTCPRVKAIEYFDNGAMKRVEFHPPSMPVQLSGNNSIFDIVFGKVR